MSRTIRYFYDCEFIEDGKTIDLASIGIASSDGRTFYAVNRGVHWERLGHPKFAWIRENVWPHLPTTGPGQLSLDRHHLSVMDHWEIARNVHDFILIVPAQSKIELWGDYTAYDHVALAQLWGRMVDLPAGIPMRTNDIIQYAEMLGISESDFPIQSPKTRHHALHDAKHHKLVFEMLQDAEKIAGRRVALSGATGVQIGNGNVQSNTF